MAVAAVNTTNPRDMPGVECTAGAMWAATLFGLRPTLRPLMFEGRAASLQQHLSHFVVAHAETLTNRDDGDIELEVSMGVSLEELLVNQRPTFSSVAPAMRLLVLSGPEGVREWVARAHQRQDSAAEWLFQSDVCVAYIPPVDAVPLVLLALQEARRQCLDDALLTCSAASVDLQAARDAAARAAEALRERIRHAQTTKHEHR